MNIQKEATIQQSFVGLLYEDGAFSRVLKPGKHKLTTGWRDKTERSLRLVDMRERSLTIKGQEILTADKVAIRVSLLVYFRVTDAVAASHNVASYEERIYEDVQLAARRFLASRSLDSILTDRNEISDTVKTDVLSSAGGYGVEILRADVKDLVFPGNLREIMNRVLETERKAEASIIEAKNAAESIRIESEARNRAEIAKINAEKEMIRMRAEAELEKVRAELESKTMEAEALKENPELLKILQIEMIKGLASRGATIYLGLDGKTTKSLIDL